MDSQYIQQQIGALEMAIEQKQDEIDSYQEELGNLYAQLETARYEEAMQEADDEEERTHALEYN